MYVCLGILAVAVIPITTVAGIANDFNCHIASFSRRGLFRGSLRVKGHFFCWLLIDCLVVLVL